MKWKSYDNEMNDEAEFILFEIKLCVVFVWFSLIGLITMIIFQSVVFSLMYAIGLVWSVRRWQIKTQDYNVAVASASGYYHPISA